MTEATDADDGDERNKYGPFPVASGRTVFMEKDREVFFVVAEDGIASQQKIERETEYHPNTIRGITRKLEREGLLLSKGRDSLARGPARYCLSRDGREYVDG